MNLVENIPLQAKVVDAPPVKLDYESVKVPENVDFNFIGIEHDAEYGEPDYLSAVLEETDVVFLEAARWTPAQARRYQKIAGGSLASLREALRETEKIEEDNPTFATWKASLYTQLYESKVRVIMAEYPKNHPESLKIDRAMRKGYITEDDFPLLANRDKFIMGRISGSVEELRRHVQSIKIKQPLHATALYGVAHYGVADALSAAAAEQTVTSFTSRLRFEDRFSQANLLVRGAECIRSIEEPIIDYQNWIRTPEN